MSTLAETDRYRGVDTATALRLLQQLDQVGRLNEKGLRLLREAQDILGKPLGLHCTGVDDGDGFFSHDGDTCPIHEWLVPEDYEAIEEEA
jgi:hypothetical protein